MRARWRVIRWNSLMFPGSPWYALEPGHPIWHTSNTTRCRCRRTTTWREAFDYADRMARADR